MSQLLLNGTVALNKPELVLFDKDGTLIDIHHYWVSLIKIRASVIIQRWFGRREEKKEIERALVNAMGVDLTTLRMKPEGPVGVKPRPFIVQVAADIVRGNGVELSNEDMEALFAEVDLQTAKDMGRILKILPGVLELLEGLKKCGVASAVVSTDITSRVRKAMEILKLGKYFTDIIGGDFVKNSKPAPDLALYVINKYQFAPEKVVVIGDHVVDIKMGESANVGLNVGVLTGLSGAKAFDGLNCAVVPDLHSIEVRC